MEIWKIAGIGLAIGGGVGATYLLGVKPILDERARKEDEDKRREEAQGLVRVALVDDGTLYFGDIDCTQITVELKWALTGRPIVAQTIEHSKNGTLYIGTHECGPLKGRKIDSSDGRGQVTFNVSGRTEEIWVKVFDYKALITIPEDLLVPLSSVS